MITCAFFLTLLLITVFGGKIEEEGANVHKLKKAPFATVLGKN